MKAQNTYSINVRGQLMSLSEPQVMGILNITPDSFYSGSRTQTEEQIVKRLHQLVEEGADIIDIGAYSTRPGAQEVPADEEMRRLALGLQIIRREYPDAVVSVDTFRADVARRCVTEFDADIINDISGGELDADMFATVADLHVPYILTHMLDIPRETSPSSDHNIVMREVLHYFAKRVTLLCEMGVNDIILDPGFGFGKTLDENYQLMAHMEALEALKYPVLVGISRKSMIHRLLGITPEESLNGTTVLHVLSLLRGANILRVHDVKQAKETIKIVRKCLESV